MRAMLYAVVLVCLCAFCASAQADILWQWSFDTEAGTFLTDGTLNGDQADSGNYTILDFTVTESVSVSLSQTGEVPSLIGSLSGGFFTESQPTQGFGWSGQNVTSWWRSGGAHDNGSAFYYMMSDSMAYRYAFSLNRSIMDLYYASVYAEGSVVVTPVPEPATLALLGLGGGLLLRRRR